MGQLDRFVWARMWLLLAGAAGFAIWQVGELSPVKPALDNAGLSWIVPVGIVIWAAAVLPSLIPLRRQLRAMLEDERVRHNRLIAAFWGYCAMALGAAAGISFGSRDMISADDLSRLLLIVGISVPLVTLALLERPVSDGD